MELVFRGETIYWKGPAPWYFVAVPEEESLDIEAISRDVTYGWGCIPVEAQVGRTVFETALFPKDGRYLVPVKVAVRRAERIDVGDTVDVRLTIAG
jgi:hypothetical protein